VGDVMRGLIFEKSSTIRLRTD
jgi:hypothetical protein